MIDKIMELYKERTKKDCYKIEIEDGVTPEVMDDKLGGIPYLPVGEEYPLDKKGNPMVLAIQVNLENIDLEDFPKKGILEIYIDKDLDWPCDYKVKYFKEITDYRKDIELVESYMYEKPLKIKLVKDIDHMSPNDYKFPEVMGSIIKEVTGNELNTYFDIWDYIEEQTEEEDPFDAFNEYNVNNFPGNVSGYPDFTQTDPRPIKGSEDKTECLVKIDSNLRHGVMIGDSGILFAFISKEDLKAGNLETAIVDWACC